MTKRQKEGQLDQEEKRIVKLMLAQGERNQDIQALLNLGRMFTVNSARITEVKQNVNQPQATVQELENFKFRKHSFDPQTGLNTVVDERLVRAREAMILAVQVFNSAHFISKLKFSWFSAMLHGLISFMNITNGTELKLLIRMVDRSCSAIC